MKFKPDLTEEQIEAASNGEIDKGLQVIDFRFQTPDDSTEEQVQIANEGLDKMPTDHLDKKMKEVSRVLSVFLMPFKTKEHIANTTSEFTENLSLVSGRVATLVKESLFGKF